MISGAHGHSLACIYSLIYPPASHGHSLAYIHTPTDAPVSHSNTHDTHSYGCNGGAS